MKIYMKCKRITQEYLRALSYVGEILVLIESMFSLPLTDEEPELLSFFYFILSIHSVFLKAMRRVLL